ncbi:MAG: hypothetical protein ACK4PI_14425 [Tepidisphaerales bacterium]
MQEKRAIGVGRCGAGGRRGMAGLSAVLAAAVLGGVLAAGGCGPSKRRPVEVDVSGVPAEVLASFRRDQPNSIIRGGRAVPEGYRIDYWSPLRKREWVVYNLEGDKLKSSQ